LPTIEFVYVMTDSGKGLPGGEDSTEKVLRSLSKRSWRRKRWRKRRGEPVAHCVSCGAYLNRKDSYYVRPAYTDGSVWLCSGCYDRMTETAHIEKDHRYGRRSRGD